VATHGPDVGLGKADALTLDSYQKNLILAAAGFGPGQFIACVEPDSGQAGLPDIFKPINAGFFD
jgi:hypothetical protein